MMMISRHRHCRLLSIATILALQWTGNYASQQAPDVPFEVIQPDGSLIQVVPNGNAQDNYLTDTLGYGIEQDESGYYVYVGESETGEVVYSKETVGKDGPKDKKKKKKMHKKKTDCNKKMCGGTPEDPRKASKRSRTLRGSSATHHGRALEEPDQMAEREIQTTGVLKNLVVLLHFKDHAEHKDRKDDIPTREAIDFLMNSDESHPEVAPIGSLKSIYKEVSYGKLTIESTVTEWFVTKETESWYADGDSGTTNLHQALRDSLDYLDQNNIVNFTEFDSNQDGQIDAITFLHSGYAAEWMARDRYGGTYRNRIWSHKWNIWSDASGRNIGPWESKDGISVYDYHISPALWGVRGTDIGHVGVIAHETGHFIDLDDLYDTNGGGNGIGNYCFMASSWGWDKSQEPPGSMTCWTKAQLGWLTPQKVQYGVNTLSDSITTPDCIKIGDGEHGFPEGEYLLIENRQPRGLDSKIPQGGLAIFHIDEKIKHDLEGHPGQYGWPLNGRHYRVALLQADGDFDLERQINHGDSGDLFHGDGVDKLLPSASTNRGPFPNTDSYQRGRVRQTGVEIYGISKSNATMTFIFTDGTVELPSAQPSPIASSSPSDLPSTVPTDSPSSPSASPSSTPSLQASSFSSQCLEEGTECENVTECCNDKAECKVVEKRQRKKVCSK
ncbi:unnamed protein product [Cylindrotheca closterium]|uniref:Peptidase M6-like domain-containing protein n=1 Tax=Cylindrotheca closterium TaxID=2856 RepID=A0AAD2FS36_9STRA|nr:unnamed protein product [Cylindrotheca closterium]